MKRMLNARFRRSEAGMALVLVTIVMALGMLVIPPLLNFMGGAGRSAQIRENRMLLLFTAVTCLFTFWNVSENFMLVSGAQILGIPKEEFWTAVILYWLINVTFAPTAFFAGRFSDKYGRKIPIISGMLVLGIMTLGFAFAFNLVTVGILFMMHGIYQGLFTPSVQAWIADLAPTDKRGEVIGTFKMLVGLSDIPGPFVFGLIWDLFNFETPFIIGGIFCLLCALLLWFIPMKRND